MPSMDTLPEQDIVERQAQTLFEIIENENFDRHAEQVPFELDLPPLLDPSTLPVYRYEHECPVCQLRVVDLNEFIAHLEEEEEAGQNAGMGQRPGYIALPNNNYREAEITVQLLPRDRHHNVILTSDFMSLREYFYRFARMLDINQPLAVTNIANGVCGNGVEPASTMLPPPLTQEVSAHPSTSTPSLGLTPHFGHDAAGSSSPVTLSPDLGERCGLRIATNIFEDPGDSYNEGSEEKSDDVTSVGMEMDGAPPSSPIIPGFPFTRLGMGVEEGGSSDDDRLTENAMESGIMALTEPQQQTEYSIPAVAVPPESTEQDILEPSPINSEERHPCRGCTAPPAVVPVRQKNEGEGFEPSVSNSTIPLCGKTIFLDAEGGEKAERKAKRKKHMRKRDAEKRSKKKRQHSGEIESEKSSSSSRHKNKRKNGSDSDENQSYSSSSASNRRRNSYNRSRPRPPSSSSRDKRSYQACRLERAHERYSPEKTYYYNSVRPASANNYEWQKYNGSRGGFGYSGKSSEDDYYDYRRGRKGSRRSRPRSGDRNRRRSRSRSRSFRERSTLRRLPPDYIIDKSVLLDIARKNAAKLVRSGVLPTDIFSRDQILAIKAGGKSVKELTEYCKRIAKRDAAGDANDSSDEEHRFNHQFTVKDRPMPHNTMNIRDAIPLPIRTPHDLAIESTKMKIIFPVSSGTRHRFKELEWKKVDKEEDYLTGKHPVSSLMELCTKRRWGEPTFELCFRHGPPHRPNFIYKVTLNGVEYQPCVTAKSKKEAKANAAAFCLQSLGLLPITKAPTPATQQAELLKTVPDKGGPVPRPSHESSEIQSNSSTSVKAETKLMPPPPPPPFLRKFLDFPLGPLPRLEPAPPASFRPQPCPRLIHNVIDHQHLEQFQEFGPLPPPTSGPGTRRDE